MNHRTPLPARKLLIAAVAAWALATALPPPAVTGQDRSWEQYRVLVDRNIFLRDRRRPQPPGSRPARPAEREYDSDRGIVLTGVARRGEEFVAFFEEAPTGATTKVRVGQAIGRGKLMAIELDGIEYERAGSLRRIDIGRSLAGTAAAMPSPRAASTQPAGPPSGAGETTTSSAESTTEPGVAPSGPSPDNASNSDISDILERMRRRREQELGK